jgi:hypothetical protein
MPISTLVSNTREDLLTDTELPYLWSDTQLTRYANEACKEACIRMPLIERTQRISIAATNATYRVNEFTRRIKYVKLALEDDPLTQTTEAELERSYGRQWRTITGTPRHYIRKGRVFTCFPIPIVNDTLTIKAASLPDDDFDFDEDIDPVYHESLQYWIAYRAFLKPDADAYNPVKAAEFLGMFNAYFGPSHTAQYYNISLNNPVPRTVVGGRMC